MFGQHAGAIGSTVIEPAKRDRGSRGATGPEGRPQWLQVLRICRAPDLVIGARVVLAFVVIGLYSLPLWYAFAALVMTIVVIAMDGLDGLLARRLGLTSELGAVLDITGDRIVEHVFWIYFAVVHQVPLWVPIVFVTRSFVVDTVRTMALSRGKTAFGDQTMMQSRLSRFLVASRFMRASYGAAKVAAFVSLGAMVVLQKADAASILTVSSGARSVAATATQIIVLVTVALNLIRGVPVVWDSRGFLRHVDAGDQG